MVTALLDAAVGLSEAECSCWSLHCWPQLWTFLYGLHPLAGWARSHGN